MCFTFLASSILFSKMYVMQFLTTSSLRALLASTLPFLSTMSPVGRQRGDQRHIHHLVRDGGLITHTLRDRLARWERDGQEVQGSSLHVALQVTHSGPFYFWQRNTHFFQTPFISSLNLVGFQHDGCCKEQGIWSSTSLYDFKTYYSIKQICKLWNGSRVIVVLNVWLEVSIFCVFADFLIGFGRYIKLPIWLGLKLMIIFIVS